MRTLEPFFAEEFDRVLIEADTSVGRLARLSGVSRRTLENWRYGNTLRPRNLEQILQVARALRLQAMDTDRLLLSAGHPTLSRLRQKKQLQQDILLEWQLPPDLQKGQKNAALHHAQQLLQQMPWNEEAHREVMELLAVNGRRSEALKQFEVCRQALQDELGVEPSTETLALYERIKRTTHFSRDNIPAIVTPLIGREAELASLSRLLADPGVRLITITGLGGIGKTRLALETAWRHTEGQFKDGVTFVPLEALEPTEEPLAAIARALHLPLNTTSMNPARHLLDFLARKQALLVLDNCEHLLAGMAIAAEILESATQLQILATSRTQLHLRGEHVFKLQGLDYSEDQRDHPAAQLFSAAAQRILPDFAIDKDNATHVNQLCRMVDGMPLALELAATWLDTMSTGAVIGEIENGLDIRAAGLQNIPPRHRSLQAVLESTWRQLQPQTRQVFAALSVLRGSFSRDAAQEMAGASPRELKKLVAHTLLQFSREDDRYQLHEMLGQFAAEKLSQSPDFGQVVRRRHLAYYSALAQTSNEAMQSGDQMACKARLESEEDNLRKAIDWAIDNDIVTGARMVVALRTFWFLTGRMQEAMQQVERIMPHLESLPSELQPWLMTVYAHCLYYQGYTQESVALETDALPLFLDQGDEAGAAFIYLLWSYTARRIGKDIHVSIQLAEAGLQHALTKGTGSYYASLLLDSLSDSLTRSGRFSEAAARIEQGYQMCLERNDLLTANYMLAQKVLLAAMQGEGAQARRLAEDYLRASRQTGMLIEEILALENLGSIAFAAGDFEAAEEFTTVGIALAREANYRNYLADLDIIMGDILMVKGANQEALPFLREALRLAQEMNSLFRIAPCVERLARWMWQYNKKDPQPVCWIAAAMTYGEAIGHIQSPSEIARQANVRTELATGLGEDAFAIAWLEGEQMSLEDALEELNHSLYVRGHIGDLGPLSLP